MGRALLLDVDGVLVAPPQPFSATLTAPGSLKNLLTLASRRKAVQAFFHGPFLMASTGDADLKRILPPYLAELGYAGTPAQFMAEWFGHENCLNLPLLDEVQRLRGKGWRTYLATNQEQYRLKYLMGDMGLEQLVDGELSSCTLGVRKPDAGYFGRVQVKLKLPPEQIVFWDDAAGNVEAALEAGWAAHLYTDLAGFQRVMDGI
jgi:putative hydrolase of the HAD superfamily